MNISRPVFSLLVLVSLLFGRTTVGRCQESELPQTGSFETTFEESSPISDVTQQAKRINVISKDPLEKLRYDIKQETFSVYVPDSYDGTRPYGLIVFISSGKGAGPKMSYKEVLDKHRLIWISGTNVGNHRKPVCARVGLAIDAVYNMQKRYKIDPERIYCSGFSGGGAMAAMTTYSYPDVFSGAALMCAPGFVHGSEPAGGPIVDDFYNFGAPPPAIAEIGRQRLRIAVLSGSKDFNKDSKQYVVQKLGAFGYRGDYFEQPGMGHSTVNAEYFEKAIQFLDSPLQAAAKANFPKALASYERKKYGAAYNGLRAAFLYGDEELVAKATAPYQDVYQQRKDDFEAVRTLIKENKKTEARKRLLAAKRKWKACAKEEIDALMAEVKKMKNKR